MQIYTSREASKKTKIGEAILKRAFEEGLIPATRLSNGQWRVAESALEEALREGLDLRNLSKRKGKKQAQPEALKRYQDQKRAEKASM